MDIDAYEEVKRIFIEKNGKILRPKNIMKMVEVAIEVAERYGDLTGKEKKKLVKDILKDNKLDIIKIYI